MLLRGKTVWTDSEKTRYGHQVKRRKENLDMYTLQLSFWIAGWVVIGMVVVVFICATITSYVKQIITHHYVAKTVYAAKLMEMQTAPSPTFNDVIDAITKKSNGVGKETVK